MQENIFPSIFLENNNENNQLFINNIQIDPNNQIFISGYSNGENNIIFGNYSQSLPISSNEDGFFIASFDSMDGSFRFVLDFISSSENEISLSSFTIADSGELYCLLNNKNNFIFNEENSIITPGSSIIQFKCENSCTTKEFCEIKENSFECSCLKDKTRIGNECYNKPCLNNCSNHGNCLLEYSSCECENGYLLPDCSKKILREPYNNYFLNSGHLVGNIYQTITGNIEIVDFTSFPDVGWIFIIGRFSGKAVFGDVSNNDKISETITCASNEIGSFIAMYNQEMELQWIHFLRSLQPNSEIILTSCKLQQTLNQLIITGVCINIFIFFL